MWLNWADVQIARGLPPEQPPPPGCAGAAWLRLTLEEAPGTGRTFLTGRPPRENTADYGAWLHSLIHAFFLPEDSRNRALLDADAPPPSRIGPGGVRQPRRNSSAATGSMWIPWLARAARSLAAGCRGPLLWDGRFSALKPPPSATPFKTAWPNTGGS